MSVNKSERGIAQGDNAAKVIASIIIAGLVVIFGYGLIGWIVFG
jgi:hypothetical protein